MEIVMILFMSIFTMLVVFVGTIMGAYKLVELLLNYIHSHKG